MPTKAERIKTNALLEASNILTEDLTPKQKTVLLNSCGAFLLDHFPSTFVELVDFVKENIKK